MSQETEIPPLAPEVVSYVRQFISRPVPAYAALNSPQLPDSGLVSIWEPGSPHGLHFDRRHLVWGSRRIFVAVDQYGRMIFPEPPSFAPVPVSLGETLTASTDLGIPNAHLAHCAPPFAVLTPNTHCSAPSLPPHVDLTTAEKHSHPLRSGAGGGSLT